MTKQHNVEKDYAGFGGHPRLTCYTCGTTLLKQPYITLQDWKARVKEFAEKHPSPVSEHYNALIQTE